jgi:hypothetical protein
MTHWWISNTYKKTMIVEKVLDERIININHSFQHQTIEIVRKPLRYKF